METLTRTMRLKTKGDTDVINITSQVEEELKKSGLKSGALTIFAVGSTAGLTTVEYEPGLIQDLKEAFEKVAPTSQRYHHHERYGEDNGFAHIRSSLVGTSFTVPFVNGRLTLGTWQQIVFLDFDNRPRSREVILQFLGE